MTSINAPVAASLLAKWFIAKVEHEPEQDLSNLKLQKLLYMAHSLFLHEHKVALVAEDFQAWNHGPVVGILYREYKPHGEGPIQMELAGDGPWTRLSTEVVDALERTWMGFGGYSAPKLREITHQLGPWPLIHQPGVKNLVIPNESIGASWPEFESLTEKPVVDRERADFNDVLNHFDKLSQKLPARHPKGDPVFLLDELDSLEELRKHAASQIL